LGAAAEPEDRCDSGPEQLRGAVRRQARDLPRRVQPVLRAPARAHGLSRVRRCAGRVPEVARATVAARGEDECGLRAAVLELPRDPRHAGPVRRRPGPHARRVADDARRRLDPEHPGGARALDHRFAVDQAGERDAGHSDAAYEAACARRLSGDAEVVATIELPAQQRISRLERQWRSKPGVLGWLTTTDHKRIGILYFWTTLLLFGAGGTEAMFMRTQLVVPNNHVLGPAEYDQVFTLHGITMIFFFIIPMTTGAFGNYLVPLMIGARDMAFPRMNALSYWIFLASGLFLYIGFAAHNAPNGAWFGFTPLTTRAYDPSRGADFYALSLIFNGISSTLTSANLIVTMFKLRAPGMSFNRLPTFCYAFLAASFGL